jgi:hypothetical protein
MYIPKYFLPLAISFTLGCLFSAASLAAPAIWEAQLGATITDRLQNPALDRVDDADTGNTLTFGSMSFPFDGTIYTGSDLLAISSNGLISLGGSNGADAGGSPATLLGYTFPAIALLFTDLDPGNQGGDVYINRFNDDGDPEIDRIVITYATGFASCFRDECSALAQVQLLEDGTIIFAYNGIVQTVNQSSGFLVGVTPADGATDPGDSNLSATPFDSGAEATVYEEFANVPPTTFDLDDSNVIFTPNATGGFLVSDGLLLPPEPTEPPIWESATGSTLTGALGAALDNSVNATVSLTFGSMAFPFNGSIYTDTSILNISSNGFISLGGSNGSGCENDDPTRCGGEPTAFVSSTFPWIAPFWTDLSPGLEGGDVFINRFNDDFDPEDDRIVITFATGFTDCAANECSVLTQVQLLEDGTIIFGYNGVVQTDSQGSDILVGVTPGSTSTPDPGNTDLSKEAPFNSVTEPTVYEVFLAASAPPFDLDGGNVVFEPNGVGGYQVTTPGIGGKSIGGSFGGGGGGGGGGCSLTGKGTFDPTLWLLVLIAAFWLKRHKKRRHSHP